MHAPPLKPIGFLAANWPEKEKCIGTFISAASQRLLCFQMFILPSWNYIMISLVPRPRSHHHHHDLTWCGRNIIIISAMYWTKITINLQCFPTSQSDYQILTFVYAVIFEKRKICVSGQVGDQDPNSTVHLTFLFFRRGVGEDMPQWRAGVDLCNSRC